MDFTPEETILQSIISARKWISAQDTLKAGLRWIFYNQTGQIRKGSEVHEYVSSPLMAEVLACKAMLRNALSSNIENLRVFGIVSNIKSLSDLFNSISFFFSRSKNV
ncbi:unnamed protein product, partial [Brassica rapa]